MAGTSISFMVVHPKPSRMLQRLIQKNGIVPINDEETITYVGGGIWDVR